MISPDIDKFEEVGLSESQGTAITETLKKCGIEEFYTIEKLLNQANSYKISTEDADNVFIYMDGDKVETIAFPKGTLYNKGKVIAKLSDYIISLDEQVKIKIMSEDLVRNTLKTPSIAKFPSNSEWNIWKEKGVIYVQSYVDSENSFGAMIRNKFQLKIVNGNVTSYILGNKEMLK